METMNSNEIIGESVTATRIKSDDSVSYSEPAVVPIAKVSASSVSEQEDNFEDRKTKQMKWGKFQRHRYINLLRLFRYQ